MNLKIKEFLSNFSITLIANLLSMIVSSLVILIVPAFISVAEYGYWQLYVFYCSYTSYFSLGLTDGVYIRNGGKKYEDLETAKIRSQYWFLFLLNILLTIGITAFFFFQNDNIDKIYIVFFACLSAIIIIPRSLITMTMLSVNRIKENAIILIVDRSIYFVMIVLFFILKVNNFYFLILSDLLGQFISSILAIFMCKELVFGKNKISLYEVLRESKINIAIGIKIVLAGLASMLIVGIIRMGIEQNWGVEEFAKVSLTLSICNLLLVFIKAISVVIFPVLCNSKLDALKKIYSISKTSLGIVLLGLLIFYYPLKVILTFWLPKYGQSLLYMAFLFPISLYESKTQLLINTYFKALRKENLLLFINVITVLLSFICSIISINLLNSINLAILSVVLLLGFRCYLSEFLLLKILELKGVKDIFVEIVISFLFILFNWSIGGFVGMALYILVYLVYLYIKREHVKNLIINIKNVLVKN